jgi:hypothetical protein
VCNATVCPGNLNCVVPNWGSRDLVLASIGDPGRVNNAIVQILRFPSGNSEQVMPVHILLPNATSSISRNDMLKFNQRVS